MHGVLGGTIHSRRIRAGIQDARSRVPEEGLRVHDQVPDDPGFQPGDRDGLVRRGPRRHGGRFDARVRLQGEILVAHALDRKGLLHRYLQSKFPFRSGSQIGQFPPIGGVPGHGVRERAPGAVPAQAGEIEHLSGQGRPHRDIAHGRTGIVLIPERIPEPFPKLRPMIRTAVHRYADLERRSRHGDLCGLDVQIVFLSLKLHAQGGLEGEPGLRRTDQVPGRDDRLLLSGLERSQVPKIIRPVRLLVRSLELEDRRVIQLQKKILKVLPA